jgi:hypothetical protein
MATANVSVTFNAASAEEAAGLIARWTLHEGCRVSSSFTEATDPMVTDSEGSIVPMPEPEPPPEASSGE